jgi:hypothetical protein
MQFDVAKLDAEQQLVFGWANVAADADGALLVERAAYAFVLQFGETGEQHQGGAVGRVVESFFVTDEKLAAMGLTGADGAPKAGWWVGFKVTPETFAKVKAGAFTMFSIQGDADF